MQELERFEKVCESWRVNESINPRQVFNPGEYDVQNHPRCVIRTP